MKQPVVTGIDVGRMVLEDRLESDLARLRQLKQRGMTHYLTVHDEVLVTEEEAKKLQEKMREGWKGLDAFVETL